MGFYYCPITETGDFQPGFYACFLHKVNFLLVFSILSVLIFNTTKGVYKEKWTLKILSMVFAGIASPYVHYYTVIFFFFFCCRLFSWFMFLTLGYYFARLVRKIYTDERENISTPSGEERRVIDNFNSHQALISAEVEESGMQSQINGTFASPPVVNIIGFPEQSTNFVIVHQPVFSALVPPFQIVPRPVLDNAAPPLDSRRTGNKETKNSHELENSIHFKANEQRTSTDRLKAIDLPSSSSNISSYFANRITPSSSEINGTASTSHYLKDDLSRNETSNSYQDTGINTKGGNLVKQQSVPNPSIPNLLLSVFKKSHPVLTPVLNDSESSSSMEEEAETNTGEIESASNQMAQVSGNTTTTEKRKLTRKKKAKPPEYHPPKKKKTKT